MMLRPTALVLALAASTLAWGEALDTPERIARLAYVEGQVSFHAAQAPAYSTLPDRPLIPGDRLVTETGGRAEITLGTSTLRLDEQTELAITDLDAANVRVELAGGTAIVRLHELLEDETFEIVTPTTSIAIDGPGEYRVTVPADGVTELTVRAGLAEIAAADGPVRVAAGQRVRLEGRDAVATLATPQPPDAFDDWVLDRELRLAAAEPLPEGPGDHDDYAVLDHYGEWYDEPSYGRVWMPSYAYGVGDPFGYGYWDNVGVRGRGWFNPAPWAFFTFYQGRWAYLHRLNRWCWVPERRHQEPRVAQDTRPFGHPRGVARPRDDTRRPTIVRSAADSRDLGGNRRETSRREVVSREKPRHGTFVSNLNRNSSPPVQASKARPGGASVLRSSRSSGMTATPGRSARSTFAVRTP